MKIGITGSSGVLGKILTSSFLDHFNFVPFQGDIKKKSDISDWLNTNNLDSILHLAAVVPTELVQSNPLNAYDVNTTGTLNLLNEALNLDKKPWIFYASSSHVYKSSKSPLNEQDDLQPISLYGKTKLFADLICQDALKQTDLKICIGRIFSFYHDYQKKPFLYPSIIERLSNEDLNKPFFLEGGESIRDFLNAEDVCKIIIKLMLKQYIGIINIGSGKGITIKQFVQKFSHKKITFKTNSKFDYLVADISKLNKIINE